MKQQRKPTGYIGPISISDEAGVEFDRIKFPVEKDQVENYVVELTLGALQRDGVDLWGAGPQRNPENHFDFTLPASAGVEYMDLMEVAPLEGTGGFRNAPLEYNHGELADWVWTKLTQKAQGYGLPRKEAIHLLLYSTDTAFRLSEGVLEILAYCCSKVDRGFKSILYSVPEDRQSAFIYKIHPRPREEFRGFNLSAKRARKSLIADFTRHEATSTVSVTVPLGGKRSHDNR